MRPSQQLGLNINDFSFGPLSFDDSPPPTDEEARIVTKKDLYGLTVKVNTILSHVDLLSVKKAEEAVKEHRDSINNFRGLIGEMVSYIDKDSDQLHGKFQAVETKIQELINAQTSELTKKVSDLTV